MLPYGLCRLRCSRVHQWSTPKPQDVYQGRCLSASRKRPLQCLLEAFRHGAYNARPSCLHSTALAQNVHVAACWCTLLLLFAALCKRLRLPAAACGCQQLAAATSRCLQLPPLHNVSSCCVLRPAIACCCLMLPASQRHGWLLPMLPAGTGSSPRRKHSPSNLPPQAGKIPLKENVFGDVWGALRPWS